jgi:acetoin utilization protein AcuC
MDMTVIYSDELKNYDFGEGHPFRSDRFNSFLKLYKENINRKNFELLKNSELACDEELKYWHTEDYIKTVKMASCGMALFNLKRFISQDNINPLTGNFPKGIEKAARAAVKNSILAVDYVLQNKSEKAVSIGGGLHHAKSSYGEGFCIYNDVVIAVKHAIKKYNLERVLLIDTDAHAGNGTCEAFYSDPTVLFIDLHQRGIYPGTGFIDEIGEGKGKGFTVNIPLKAGTGDKSYELIFDKIILPLSEEYKPQLIIRYGGADPHIDDGLTSLGLTLNGFKMIGGKIRGMSKNLCNNRSVDMICSGYNLKVLPAAWLNLIAGLAGTENDFSFEELRPPEDDGLVNEIQGLINNVKKNLKPYWASMTK